MNSDLTGTIVRGECVESFVIYLKSTKLIHSVMVELSYSNKSVSIMLIDAMSSNISIHNFWFRKDDKEVFQSSVGTNKGKIHATFKMKV